MADQEIGNVGNTGRGVVYGEQPDGSFARRLEGLVKPFAPIGSHTTDAALSSAKVLAPPAGSNLVLIQCTGANVRYTLDGTTPTAGTGFVLTADTDPLLIPIGPTTTLTIIEESASATAQFQFGA